MKGIIKEAIVMLLIIISLTVSPDNVSAEEIEWKSGYCDEASEQVDEMLADYNIGISYAEIRDMSIGDIISAFKDETVSRIKSPFVTLTAVIMVIVFGAFIKSAGEISSGKEASEGIQKLITVLASSALILPPLINVYRDSAKALDRGGGFMLVFVPIFAGISALSGRFSAIGVYNGIVLGSAELMIEISKEIIMPIMLITTGMAVCGSVFGNGFLDSAVQLIRKLTTWTMTITMTLFTGFLSMKSTLGTAADGFAVKTVKFMVSGFIPVIGGAISDAYSAVKGSFDILRCTAGTAGIIGLAILMIPPIAELFAFRIVMWTANAFAGIFSSTPLDKLFRNLDAGLSVAISMLVCFSVMFIISTAILIKSFG